MFDTVNMAITERMGRLELKETGDAMDKCLQHLFHDGKHRLLEHVGYQPLSLSNLSGLFLILIVFQLLACTVFVCEWMWTRHKQTSAIRPVHFDLADTKSTQIESYVADVQCVCRAFNLRRVVIKDGVIICVTLNDK